MRAKITSSGIGGNISAPASKSAMQRALAASLIRKGRSILYRPGHSEDDHAALQIIQDLGARVEQEKDRFIIDSNGIDPQVKTLDCGESGLSVRMFTSIAALSNAPLTITGRGTLLKRPMHFFEEVLPLLNVRCELTNEKLPLQLQGPLLPADIEIDGSLSSQYLTGLMFAYAASGARARIRVKDLVSRPYIDLTLDTLKRFNLNAPVNENYETFIFGSGKVHTADNTIEYNVEGDWSGGSFFLVAGAIGADIEVTGLDLFSTQADKAILQALHQANAIMSVQNERIIVGKSTLQPFHFDARDCPDLFPPLVALAAFCNGTSVIEGVSRLRHKESDRASTLVEEFSSMGVNIDLQDDLMVVKPGLIQPTRAFDSHHDHRIAMAIAVASIGMGEEIIINGAEAVKKSYPDFWKDLANIGVGVSLTDN
jgi:3-phosphoshikimate 1-carboxyvinyltransferase